MIIAFDMDGTIADFYGQKGWLADLLAERTAPYDNAKPLFNFSVFSRTLHKLQANGYRCVIVSCTSKNGTAAYNERVAEAKRKWLRRHLPSIQWDGIYIIDYSTPKSLAFTEPAILFDDEERHRKDWQYIAYDEKDILKRLRALL